MNASVPPSTRDEFVVAIICALRIESDAVEALFDETWDENTYGKADGDMNAYIVGRIGNHNAVLVFMPGMGKSNAASVATSCSASFRKIRLGLVVGVCGAIPILSEDQKGGKKEIILGDVIISTGVVQYDFARQLPNKATRKDTLEGNLGRQNVEIRAFLARLQGLRTRTRLKDDHLAYLQEISRVEGLEHTAYPGRESDKLFEPSYRHKHQETTSCHICAACQTDQHEVCKQVYHLDCDQTNCSDGKLVSRERLADNRGQGTANTSINLENATHGQRPEIHFGRIASGDLIIKSGRHRDAIALEEGVIAFEMEGAGVWDQIPTIIIKGVCDYADSHKNKKWQPYAAASAAACMKALLRTWYVETSSAKKRDSSGIPRESTPYSNPPSSQQVFPNVSVSGQGWPQISGSNVTGNKFDFGNNMDTQSVNGVRRSEETIECLQHHSLKDPRIDKLEILAKKDELLSDSCSWVWQDDVFQEWWTSTSSRILWLHGEPGKGKTMLMIAMSDYIAEQLAPKSQSSILAYFFCQSTIQSTNTATSVLRGLVYMLVTEYPNLSLHLQKRYNMDKESLFDGPGALYSLHSVLANIAQDPSVDKVYLMVDALDECNTDQNILLDMITRNDMGFPLNVKWLISSRNDPHIRGLLESGPGRLHTSLEVNSERISQGVERFISFKLDQLTRLKNYDSELCEHLKISLTEKSENTYLWVSLVCKQLQEVSLRKTRAVVKGFPKGLHPLYERMLNQVNELTDKDDVEYCYQILRATAVAHHPLSLAELVFVATLPDTEFQALEHLEDLISVCGSFLALRNSTVYFIHQSAKDYLDCSSYVFPAGKSTAHLDTTQRCLGLISNELKEDMCNLQEPGKLVEEISEEDLDQCIAPSIRYASHHWIEHLELAVPNHSCNMGSKVIDLLHHFFKFDLLHWIECLSLTSRLSHGLLGLLKLRGLIKNSSRNVEELNKRLEDAIRFLSSHKSTVEAAPLQLYTSALIFSPRNSITRITYLKATPRCLTSLPRVDDDWDACLQTFEGHRDDIFALTFLPPGDQTIISVARYEIVLWDRSTGQARWKFSTIADYGWLNSYAVSPDGAFIVIGSEDYWFLIDARSGKLRFIFARSTHSISPIAFSALNGNILALGSDNNTVKLLDIGSGQLKFTLTGHETSVHTLALSPSDGRILASASYDSTVKLWDTRSGELKCTLKGHVDEIRQMVFSTDSTVLAARFSDGVVDLWNITSGQLKHALEEDSDMIATVAISPTGRLLASGSYDGAIKLWDTMTGGICLALIGHAAGVNALAFSPNGRLVASGSDDITVQLWDTVTGERLYTFHGHTEYVTAVMFSLDGQLIISGSQDMTIKSWDARNYQPPSAANGHNCRITAIAFSCDGSTVASGSSDGILKMWSAKSTTALTETNAHSKEITGIRFSPDDTLMLTASREKILKLWNVATCHNKLSINVAGDLLDTIAFSPNGTLVLTGEHRLTRIWDASNGETKATFELDMDTLMRGISISPDEQLVALASQHRIQVRVIMTGQMQAEIKPTWACVNEGQERRASWVEGAFYKLDALEFGRLSRVLREKPHDFWKWFSSMWNNSQDLELPELEEPAYTLDTSEWYDVWGKWILCRDKRELCLPANIRPNRFKSGKDMLALGSGSGYLTILHLQPD